MADTERERNHHAEDLRWRALALIARGADLATVGRRLHVSEATVTRLLREVRTELGANSTVHAVFIAARRGLL